MSALLVLVVELTVGDQDAISDWAKFPVNQDPAKYICCWYNYFCYYTDDEKMASLSYLNYQSLITLYMSCFVQTNLGSTA